MKNDKDNLRILTPLGAFALSIGCAVGWGSFVMPGNTFLPLAGPLGTALGMAAGAGIMLIIAACYHYLMQHWPDSGGAFSYVKNVLGYDHGFLCAWFLVLAYMAVAWANATAIILIARNIFGDVLQFGFHYTLAGYDIYGGEVLVTLGAILFFGIVAMQWRRLSFALQTIMAFVLIGGIAVGFTAAFVKNGMSLSFINPGFAPKSGHPAVQILHIAALAPWAFVGFESISHTAEEFKFPVKKAFKIMLIAVIIAGFAYSMLNILAVSALPTEYNTWPAYIRNLSYLNGLKGLPTFYAVGQHLGTGGLLLLGLTIFGGVTTGLIGNFIATSRLLYALSKEDILPKWFMQRGKSGSPKNAVLFLTLISLIIPFVGRSAIGWIVDVSTVCATIAYGYVSITAWKLAKSEGKSRMRVCAMTGFIISFFFSLYFLVPNFFSVSALGTASYLILVAWSVLGFVFFRFVFNRDEKRRFGKSTVVWVALLFLILFVSHLWLRQSMNDATENVVHDISDYYESEMENLGYEISDEMAEIESQYVEEQIADVRRSLQSDSILQILLIIVSLLIMFSVYSTMQKREKDMEIEKFQAERSNKAKSTFLSNMSHDIRTPMNAIVGYTALAKKEKDVPPKIADYMDKIDTSSQHLLALINDVLEMSRIESGKMDLDPAPEDLIKTMDEVRDMFATQMDGKKINYTVDSSGVKNRYAVFDKNRINRVLLNLISNAYKFTPEGGNVWVTLREKDINPGRERSEYINYELSVKDSGIGMSPEFAARVFEAFERERSKTVSGIQGTGLGMAITKSIVDLMGGTIDVITEKGKGTEFLIHLSFPCASGAEIEELEKAASGSGDDGAALERFKGKRLLLVDDMEMNREIGREILEMYGFTVEEAEDGKKALDMVAASEPGYYAAVLMDVQMPVMNGYEATGAIRKLGKPELANIPIIALSANAFEEDIQASLNSGMDAHISKPIEIGKLLECLNRIVAE